MAQPPVLNNKIRPTKTLDFQQNIKNGTSDCRASWFLDREASKQAQLLVQLSLLINVFFFGLKN